MQHQDKLDKAVRRRRASALVWLALALAGCGRASVERPVSEVRVARLVGDERAWGLTSAERFGFPGASGGHAGADTPDTARGAPPVALEWSTPEGWSERPPSSLRQADWLLSDGAECTLTILAGGGGGLEANVQRWRAQLSLAPATPEELAALPRAQLLGAEARLLELSGTWVGMQGDQARAEHALLGLLSVDASEARFLKLVGPAARVRQERERFLALAASLRRAQAPEPPADPSQTPPLALQRAAGLAWQLPAGWREDAARAFRVATFRSDEHPAVECYVTLLHGDGGGVEANLARWREQLGSPEARAEVVERRALDFLGGGGALVEIHAPGPEGAALLGAVRALGDRTLFVKLTGPRAALEVERERFLSFCSSLREEAR